LFIFKTNLFYFILLI